MPAASRNGRIPNTEWPAIVARRQNGETYAAIARDYDVTGPAIKYIVDKAVAAGVTPEVAPAKASEAPADAPVEAGDTPEAGDSEPRRAKLGIASAKPAETPAPSPSETESAPIAELAPDDPPANDVADHNATGGTAPAETPLARRLFDASAACVALIEKAERIDAGMDETLKDALHQVRRAVAAVEIELSRSGGQARPAPIRQAPRQAPQDRPAPAARPDARPAGRAAPDLPSDDGGGFGTHVVQGTVKFFHADKGFGFVIPDGGGSDIYVPLKAVRGSGLATLESEQRVRVAVTRGAKGPEAKEIEPVAA